MYWPRCASLRFHRSRSLARRRSLSRLQRSICWLAILFYGTLTLGIPLPLPLDASPKSGEIYPCMKHRCGCHSAEQCWRDCCCMTAAEKLAWARENNVTPPDYVLAEAKARGLLDEEPKEKCCCCCAKPAKPCCESDQISNCCQPNESKTQSNDHGDVRQQQASASVSLLSALKCRGAGDTWIGAPVSLTPPLSCDGCHEVEVIGFVTVQSRRFSSVAISPPTPPPRYAAV